MNNSKISIRRAILSDLSEMLEMFVDSISTVCKEDYSLEQIQAWTSSIDNTQRWMDKLNLQYFLIAELKNKIVGFASLANNTYVDVLYVHKDYQRQGIATRLYTEIEKEATQRRAMVLSSDVSKTAQPFFEQKGFVTAKPQTNIINGVKIINYKMIKKLQQESN